MDSCRRRAADPRSLIEWAPMPSTVAVVRSSLITSKRRAAARFVNRILRIAAFQNPEFYKAQAMRLSTFDKPRVIGCGETSATPGAAARVPGGGLELLRTEIQGRGPG